MRIGLKQKEEKPVCLFLKIKTRFLLESGKTVYDAMKLYSLCQAINPPALVGRSRVSD